MDLYFGDDVTKYKIMFGHHTCRRCSSQSKYQVRSLLHTSPLPSPPDATRSEIFLFSQSDGNLRCFNRCGWKIEPGDYQRGRHQHAGLKPYVVCVHGTNFTLFIGNRHNVDNPIYRLSNRFKFNSSNNALPYT